MIHTKSFSIDSLLAKDPPRCQSPLRRRTDPVTSTTVTSPLPSPDRCRSPDSYRSSPLSERSTPEGQRTPSPRITAGGQHLHHGPGGFIPRPGLLHLQSGAPQLPHGAFHNHPYPFSLHPGSNPSVHSAGPSHGQTISMLPGSAFHSPMEQAMKMAQAQAHIQNIHLDMLARSGVYMPRLMDYASKLLNNDLFKIIRL